MTKTVFIRVIDSAPESKGRALVELTAALRGGEDTADLDSTFFVRADEFSSLPQSPFAYWTGTVVRRIFRDFPPLEGNLGTVKQGLATADDFRFVRTRWEVDPNRIGYSLEDTEGARGWVYFAKGGSYAPYYADVHLVVNWKGRGREIKNRLNPKTGRPKSNVWMLAGTERDHFFRRGLTWPRRSKGFNLRQLPAGVCFADKGPVIIPDDRSTLPTILAIGNSRLVSDLIQARMAAGSYEAGVIQRTPMPPDLPKGDPAGTLELVRLTRLPGTQDETTHDFRAASLLDKLNSSLVEATAELGRREQDRRKHMELKAEAIERYVQGLYEVKEDGQGPVDPDVPTNGEHSGHAVEGSSPADDPSRHVADLLMWCVGVAFGRWDVRMAKDDSLIPELQGPFDRLPQIAPGGLVGPDALPATRNLIASEAWLRARRDVITRPDPLSFDSPDHITSVDYPVQVAWDGILVDDPGHRCDIVGRVREVLRYVYGPERAGEIEGEAIEILRAGGSRPTSLRDWFRNKKAKKLGLSLFDFHIRRYSRSRRKAPVYWRLCTSPGRRQSSYGVWLYYHRLTDDTLWTVLNEYVGPRREREERKAEESRQRVKGGKGAAVRKFERDREKALSLLGELESFEGELHEVANGGWTPYLDDGVLINLAPLHAVVPWKEPKKMWEKLEQGDYDWAHLALRYWPERVREKCRTDRSLAIAHGLEENHQDG